MTDISGRVLLQALNGFLFIVTCDGEVFFASNTVEQYLGFHQVCYKFFLPATLLVISIVCHLNERERNK